MIHLLQSAQSLVWIHTDFSKISGPVIPLHNSWDFTRSTNSPRVQYPREKMGSHFGTLCKFSKVTKPFSKRPIFRQTSLCNPFSSPKLQTPVFKGYKTFSQVKDRLNHYDSERGKSWQSRSSSKKSRQRSSGHWKEIGQTFFRWFWVLFRDVSLLGGDPLLTYFFSVRYRSR